MNPTITQPADPAPSGEIAAAHRRFILIEQGIGAAIFNFVLNGVIAWLTFRSLERVPLWATDASIAGDLVATAFLLPFFTCLIVTALARAQVRKGKLPPMTWRRSSHPTLARLPSGTFLRSVVLGFAFLVAVGPLVVWSFALLEVDGLPLWQFITFKAVFSAALAAVVTPLIALCALGDSVVDKAPATV